MLTDLIKKQLKKHLELPDSEELAAGWRLIDQLEIKLGILEKKVEELTQSSGFSS